MNNNLLLLPLQDKNAQIDLSSYQSSQSEMSQPDLLCCPLYCGDRLILKTALRKCQVLLPRQEVCDKLEVWYKTEVMMTLSHE